MMTGSTQERIEVSQLLSLALQVLRGSRLAPVFLPRRLQLLLHRPLAGAQFCQRLLTGRELHVGGLQLAEQVLIFLAQLRVDGCAHACLVLR